MPGSCPGASVCTVVPSVFGLPAVFSVCFSASILLFRVFGDPLFEQFAPVFVIFEEVEARTGR